MDAIIQLMEARLEQHNKESTVSAPIKLVISLNVAYHILHISHALNRPRGHVILIGDAGRGRRSCATVAALLLDYKIFQVSESQKIADLHYQHFYNLKQYVDKSRQELRSPRMERRR